MQKCSTQDKFCSDGLPNSSDMGKGYRLGRHCLSVKEHESLWQVWRAWGYGEWRAVSLAWGGVCPIQKPRNWPSWDFPHHLKQWWCLSWLWPRIRCTHCGRSYRPHHGNSVSFFSPPTLVFTLSPIHRYCSGCRHNSERREACLIHVLGGGPECWRENQGWVLETKSGGGGLCNIEEESTHLGLRTCVFHW